MIVWLYDCSMLVWLRYDGVVALFENPGTIEEIAKFFKKKRANSADLDIYILFFVHISITSIRVSWRLLKSEQTFHKSSFLVFVTNTF